ncbi:MAG TPA: DUF5709 domain-containing protein [Pseudonocardia sp.]|nr:DUF5709 domain-containing protein [Pseudonocardia sp.]
MAQRDYEEQPEAPDLGASVQLESEETLAAPAGDPDALDAGYSPPDRPYLAEEDEVTARGMREGDTLDQRLRRERSEDTSTDVDRAGRIALEGEGAALETPDAMDGTDVGIDGGAAGAEEAAVHVVDDPGAPLETEPSVAGSPALDDPELDAAVGDDPEGDRARAQAARDVRADGDVFDPGSQAPAAEGSEDVRGPAADEGGDPTGADRTGRGPDPGRPRDPFDTDPAQRGLTDSAAAIDESSQSGGAAAAADGRRDVGPEAWRG